MPALPQQPRKARGTAITLLLAGVVLLLVAWTLPFNLRSLTLPLLKRAGEGTPSVARIGLEWTRSEKLGPAQLLLNSAQSLKDPGSAQLAQAIQSLSSSNPKLVIWGGWDPFLDPLLRLNPLGDKSAHSTPVMQFLITAEARRELIAFLVNSRSLGVQSLLRLRDLANTGRFIPAKRPGGQPLDSLLLLSALLYQGEHLSPSLQRELRDLADTALQQGRLGDLEQSYFDLLALARRLDWVQLCELLRRTEDTKTLGEYAHLARIAPEDFTLIYSAALFSSSADKVASYLLTYGKTGLEDLRTALRLGQGATRLLLERQLPLNRNKAPALGDIAVLGILHPQIALAVRWAAFFLACFLLLSGVDHLLFRDTGSGLAPALPHMKSGALALIGAGLLAIATEPFLLHGEPISEFKIRILIPALSQLTNDTTNPAAQPSLTNMDTSTILSIALFACLQVSMYLFCLYKIRELDRQSIPASLKLRLMDNEENLFDAGLYIGIAGTATALVLQVLQIIPANLLAAYSSNLFGIVCVALVKIRHVRPYKRSLILAMQAEPGDKAAKAPTPPADTPAPAPVTTGK